MFTRDMATIKLRRIELPTRRLARSGLAGICAVMIAILSAGCGHSEKRDESVAPFAGIPAPEVPTFLNGPMAVLLTNVDGFRAHVTLEGGMAIPLRQPVAGELMGRGSKLFFAPEPNPTTDKHSHAEDTSFMWDVAANTGYILSGPMQSYAPVSFPRGYTNIVAKAAVRDAGLEKIAGHPCQESEVTITSADGVATSFQVWRATDLKGFPLRIAAGTNGTPLSLNFSKIRLELPPEEAFVPPTDFTRYSSGEAMMNEMAMRQESIKRRRGYQPPPTDEIGLPEARNPGRTY